MLPLTYTRPVADVRVGILKVHEKWSKVLAAESVTFRTQSYLEALFTPPSDRSLHILGNLLPTEDLVQCLKSLKEHEAITHEGVLVAGYFTADEAFEVGIRSAKEISEIKQVAYPWDIFRLNGDEITNDYQLITSGRSSASLADPHTRTYGKDIFLEEGAQVRACVLNAEKGPIYLGKDSQVQEGALIKGPFALGESSVVNMGAKVRGDTTVGPHSKIGGEVSNSIVFGYSNKGHDGFLGNAVLGEWCNIGADTNNSNLKNNYTNVKMWDFSASRFKDTGLQFCGLVMADHSKCGINTMFNTGTTVGVFANIFGDGFPRNFIPSFAWGGASGFSTYQTRKAFETAKLVMQRRNKALTQEEMDVLAHIFEETAAYRVWDKK